MAFSRVDLRYNLFSMRFMKVLRKRQDYRLKNEAYSNRRGRSLVTLSTLSRFFCITLAEMRRSSFPYGLVSGLCTTGIIALSKGMTWIST